MVDTPAGDRETASLADALERAGREAAVVELAYDGLRDEPALPAVEGDVTVRGAAGFSPGVRFVAAAPDAAAWRIDTGTLVVERVRLVLASREPFASRTLFALGPGATLVCEECRLDVEDQGLLDPPAAMPAAVVRAVGDAAGDDLRSEVRMSRTNVGGAGCFLHVAGRRQVDVIWFAGRCGLAEHFLVAEGGIDDAVAGPTVNLSLADAAFACRGGFARLLDSPARPRLPVLRAFADACRFAVADDGALIEQSGLEEPNRYRSVVEWLDAGSRYAGSSVFRRLDGGAERVEADYASSGQPLAYAAEIDADLEAAWGEPPDS